jgi:hypothetical protein
MRATEGAVNGLAGSSDHPPGLISVKPVYGFPLCGRSDPGALVVSAVWAMIMSDAVRQRESPNAGGERRATGTDRLRKKAAAVARPLQCLVRPSAYVVS